MAKEMTKFLEADIATLDRSVRDIQAKLRQVKSATQNLCTMASQIAQGSSHFCSRPTPIHNDGPISGPFSAGQLILEKIDRDSPMHDEENGRR